MNTAPLLNAILPHFRLEEAVSHEHRRGWMMAGKLFDGDKLLYSYHTAGDGGAPDVYWGEGGEAAVSRRFDELNIRELAAQVYGDADPVGLDLQIGTVFECLMDHFFPLPNNV